MEGMEGGACSCDYDGDPVNVWNVRERKARKNHQCDECERTIHPREKYIYTTFIFDGRWSSSKRCVQCNQISRDYCCYILGAGEVWAHVWEHLGVCLRTGRTRP